MKKLTTHQLDVSSTFKNVGDTYMYDERKGHIVSLKLNEVVEVQQVTKYKKQLVTSRFVKVIKEAVKYDTYTEDGGGKTDADKVRNNRWGSIGLEMVNV